jgi:hypothetical protein
VSAPTAAALTSAVVIFAESAYSEELLEDCISYFFNAGCYSWIVSGRNKTPCIFQESTILQERFIRVFQIHEEVFFP